MKISYYFIDDRYRYQNIPKSLEDRNFATFDKAVEAIKANYKPFEHPYLTLALDKTDVWGMIPQQEFSHFEKPRKKEGPVYKTVEFPGIVKNYAKFNCRKVDFYKYNGYGWEKRDFDGFYNLKLGAIQEEVNKDGINWKTPVLVQFIAAERVYSPEIKEVGKPYSPAKQEVIEKGPVSDWLPVYIVGEGRSSSYVIDQKSRGTWDSCKQYFLTDYVSVTHTELVIED